MEPEGLGSVLGAVLGALGAMWEPSENVDINTAAPEEFRPLRFVGPGILRDVHPSELREIRLTYDPGGMPALQMRFGTEMTGWLANVSEMSVGQPMPVHICQEEFSAPVIREPIRAGNVMLSGHFNRDELAAAMLIVSGQVDCTGQPLARADGSGSRRRGDSRP